MLFADAARARGWSGGRLAAGIAARTAGAAALAGAVAFVSLLVVAGIPARSSAEATISPSPAANELLAVTVQPSPGIAPIDDAMAQQIARDVVTDLQVESDALRRRDPGRATAGANGARLAAIWRQIQAANGRPVVVPEYRVDRVRVTLEPAEGQAPPTVVARVVGTVALVTYAGSPPAVTKREAPVRFTRTFELALEDGRYLITPRQRGGSGGSTPSRLRPGPRLSAGSNCTTSPLRWGSTSSRARSASASTTSPRR